MKINNSSEFDLDLFFMCKYFPFTCHFATAGLNIKDENFFTNQHRDFRKQILSEKEIKFEYKLNPNLNKIISHKREVDSEFDLDNYTKDFIKFAQLGLFSFDRTNLEDSNSNFFHLVAYPVLNENNFSFFIDKQLSRYGKFLDFDLFDFDLHFNYLNIEEFINVEFQNSINFEM